MPFFTVSLHSEAVGFIAIKENSQYAAEIYVMGVISYYHRIDIGKMLLSSAIKCCRKHGYVFCRLNAGWIQSW
jgi:GNAT superfamily N-acetyltransferase